MIKGMNLDNLKSQVSSEYSTYVKNMVFGRKGYTYSIEDGLKEIQAVLDKSIIGLISLQETLVVFSTDPNSTEDTDEIGILENGSYTTLLINDLGFNVDYPISGVAKNNLEGDIIVMFFDTINTPKLINLNKIPDPFDLNKIKLFPNYSNPNFSTSQTGVGNLLSGGYKIYVAYQIGQFSSDWVLNYEPIMVTKDNDTRLDEFEGSASGIPSGKALILNFSSIDTRYEYLRIAFSYYQNGTETIFEVPKQVILGDTLNYKLTSSENRTTLSIEEVLSREIKADTISTATIFQNKLWIGNIKESGSINYQSIANDINIKWIAEIVDFEDSNTLNAYTSNTKSFMEDEVYAMYIRFRFKNGAISESYHVPGRVSVAGEKNTSTVANKGSLEGKVYQLEDTCSTNGAMSFWENEDEEYPSQGGFPVGNVRHHKFPSLRWMLNNFDTLFPSDSIADIKKTKDIRLGIRVENVNIPQELLPLLDSYEILFAERDYDNKTNLGLDYACFESGLNANNLNSTGLNINADISIGDLTGAYNLNHLFIKNHIPDLLINTPSVSSLYIKKLYDVEIQGLFVPKTSFNNNTGVFKSASQNNVFNHTFIINCRNKSSYVLSLETEANNLLRNIKSIKYYPAGTRGFIFKGENCSILELENFDSFFNNTFDTSGFLVAPDSIVGSHKEYSFIYSLKQDLKNVFVSFLSQRLISTQIIKKNLTSSGNISNNIFNGDSYLGYYNFVTTGGETSNTVDSKILSIRNLLGLAAINVTKQYNATEEISTEDEQFVAINQSIIVSNFVRQNARNRLAFSTTDFIAGIYNFQNDYNILISQDASIQNDRDVAIIYNPFETRTSKFPFRVRSSIPENESTEGENWGKFLPNDYYDVIREKGEIVNLQGFNEILLIHTRNTLLATKPTGRINLGTVNAILGAGDIFSFPPDEIQTSKNGYAGTAHRLSCKLTVLGYFFVSIDQQKLFLFSNSLEEISSYEAREWFLQNLLCQETYTQPASNILVGFTSERKNGVSVLTIPISEGNIDLLPSTVQGVTYLDYNIEYPDYKVFVAEEMPCSGKITISGIRRVNKKNFEDNPYRGIGYTTVYDPLNNRLLFGKINNKPVRIPVECPPLDICGVAGSSGGKGITEHTYNAQQGYSWFILKFVPYSITDKLELLVNGVIVATTGENADGNYGDPILGFDPNSGIVVNNPANLFGYDPTKPTFVDPIGGHSNGDAFGSKLDSSNFNGNGSVWYIGANKPDIPNRLSEFEADTGFTLAQIDGITTIGLSDQMVWCPVKDKDVITVRVSGPNGTGWNYQIGCPPLDDTRQCFEDAPGITTSYINEVSGVFDVTKPHLLSKLQDNDIVIVNGEYKKIKFKDTEETKNTEFTISFDSSSDCANDVIPSFPFTFNTIKQGTIIMSYVGSLSSVNFYIDWGRNQEFINTTGSASNFYSSIGNKEVKFYHRSTDDVFSIDLNNMEIVGSINLSSLLALTGADFSSNDIEFVVIGDLINQNSLVDLDFTDNSISEANLWSMLNSFVPVHRPTKRTIRVAGQGYTVVDDGGLGSQILEYVLELLETYNIEVLGDFDFGYYDFEYSYEYD